MTALVAQVDRSRIIDAGFQAYFPKPFAVDELIEAISNVLND